MKIENGVLVSVSSDDIKNGRFVVPENVHTIGENAFKNLSKLANVTFAGSVKEIQDGAFSGCELLFSISIPSTVEKIGDNAFYDCKNLAKIKFEKGLKFIGQRAFYNCESLLNLSIPDTVEKIGNHAFYNCCRMKKIKLPSSLKAIEPFTFKACSDLISVNMPETLEVVGKNSFAECLSLKSVRIPEKIKEIETETFLNCMNLEKVILPENLQKINEGAFSECSKLKNIKLPNSLTYIGQKTFFNCSSLQNITIPKNVLVIDNYVFYGCLNFKNITIENGVESIGKGVFKNSGVKKLIIPTSVKKIGESAFAGNPKLKYIEIQGEIPSLAQSTFMDCYSLEKVKLPTSIKSIFSYAFAGCDRLKEVNLPEGLLNISDNAFAGCYHLNNITLPSTLKTLEHSAFNSCKSLRKINIPKNVEHIKNYTFSNCEFLETITIDGNLQTIGDRAFDQCKKLKEVILPKTVTKIGEDAFRNCASLSKFYIPKTVTSTGNYNGVTFTHFSKDKDGFTFVKSQDDEQNASMKPMNIKLSILSSNWEYANMILSEQISPSVASFYNLIFARLPKSQADEFLKSHNFTFYKQVAEKHNIQNENALKFLYNLGLFKTPEEYNGKKINYAQKIGGMLVDGAHPRLKSDKMYTFGSTMNGCGFKKGFTDFFLDNVDDLVREEIHRYGFVGNSYDRFEEIQKTNTSNRGRQRQLKPTVKKFKEYLEENRYEGITEETRPIADTVSKYLGAQYAFDRSVSIMKEKDEKGTPDHILSIPLKEDLTKTSQADPFAKIDESSVKIKNLRRQIIANLGQMAQNEFSYEWLAKNDPDNLILGKYCSCCAHVDGMGYGIMRASIVDPNVQNLVVRDKNNQIVAKATFFINEKQGYGVFNTIQVSHDLDRSYREQIYKKYILGVEDFINEYNKEHPNNPLTQVNVGMGLNDLASFIEENHKYADELLKSMNYSKYGGHGNYYEGDCFRDQYIIWESDGKKFISEVRKNNKKLLLPSSIKKENADESLERE